MIRLSEVRIIGRATNYRQYEYTEYDAYGANKANRSTLHGDNKFWFDLGEKAVCFAHDAVKAVKT
jgi:hypothetical protein